VKFGKLHVDAAEVGTAAGGNKETVKLARTSGSPANRVALIRVFMNISKIEG
jgi:hypothetical protein